MAYTAVQICNMALARIGNKQPIAALTDATPEAQQCDLIFEHCRDAALRAADWAFARRWTRLTTLSLDSERAPGWGYGYILPMDVIAGRRLRPDGLARLPRLDERAPWMISSAPYGLIPGSGGDLLPGVLTPNAAVQAHIDANPGMLPFNFTVTGTPTNRMVFTFGCEEHPTEPGRIDFVVRVTSWNGATSTAIGRIVALQGDISDYRFNDGGWMGPGYEWSVDFATELDGEAATLLNGLGLHFAGEIAPELATNSTFVWTYVVGATAIVPAVPYTQVLNTDIDPDTAYLEYTARVEDLAVYPPDFVEALAWLLAAELALPLQANAALEQVARRNFLLTVQSAVQANQREAQEDLVPDGPLVAVRR